jgi:hypothetical protein
MGIKYDGLKLTWLNQAATNKTLIDWLSPPEGDIGSFVGSSDIAETNRVRVINGPAPVFSLESGTLPPGTALDINTGTIYGTLNNIAGSYEFTLSATSNGETATRTFSANVTVNSAPVWVTAAGSLGSQFDNTLASVQLEAVDPEGTPVSYSVLTGSLPRGLTLQSNTGLLSGRLSSVTDDTNFFFTVRASDGTMTADRAFNFQTKYNAPPVWITPDYLSGDLGGKVVEGKPFNVQLQATDATAGQTVTFRLDAGTLPDGIVLDGNTGVVAGVAPAVGRDMMYPFNVAATDGFKSTVRTFRIKVEKNVPPVWISSGKIGQGFGGEFIVLNAHATDPNGDLVTYTLANGSTLPGDLTMEETGTISGTLPDVVTNTNYNFTVVANDGVNAASRSLQITTLKNMPPVWNTAADLGEGIEGYPVSKTLKATDSTGANRSVTYTALAALPAGLNLDANTGLLGGVLSTVASDTNYSFDVEAAIGEQKTTQTFSFVVRNNIPPIWVSNAGLIATVLGKSDFSAQLVAQDPNATSVAYSITAGMLPAGITLNGSTGLISGVTPDVGSETTYNFTISASDGVNAPVAQAYSLVVQVNLPPVWITPAGSLGSAFETMPFSATIAANDPEGRPIAFYNAPGNILPMGLSLNQATGVINGSLPKVNNDVTTSFMLYADDNSNNQSSRTARTFTITTKFNSPPVWITNPSLGTQIEGLAYSRQLEASGVGNGPMIYTLESGVLPVGITMSKSGLLSGSFPAVTDAEDYAFTIKAFNGIKDATQDFTMRVEKNVAPVWVTASGSLGSFSTNEAVNINLSATDANGQSLTYSVVSGALPTGLSLINGSIGGRITTLSQEGQSYNFTIRASDGVLSADRPFSITLLADSTPTWITPAGSLGNFIKNKSVSVALSAADSEGQVMTYSIISGALPTGMGMTPAGVITGTTPNVTTTTSYNFTVRASDGIHYADRAFTMSVATDAPPVWTTPAGSLGTALSGYTAGFSVVATDPEGLPLTYTMVSGTLPPNMSVSGNYISTGGAFLPLTYTDTTYTFTFEVTDGNNVVQRTFSITVLKNLDPVFTTPAGSFGTYIEGTVVSNTVVVTDPENQQVTLSITSGSLPSGLSMDPFTGLISGTIGTVSTDTDYNFTVTASDSKRTSSRSFSYTVMFSAAPSFTTAAGSLGSALEQTAQSYTVNAVANGHPIEYSVRTGEFLPSGMTLNANTGVISGTLPAVTNDTTYPFYITAKDKLTNKTTDRAFSISVQLNVAPVWTTAAGNVLTDLAGTAFSKTFVATDPNGTPVTLSLISGAFPDGATFDAANGVLSGNLPTVSTDTVYTFTLGAFDGAIRSDRTFTITSQKDTAPVWTTNAGALPSGLENTGYSTTLLAVDPQGKTVTYSLNASTLPGTLALRSNGLVVGALPNVASNTAYNFTVDASDGTLSTARTFSLTVLDNRPPVWVTPAGTLGNVTEGVNGTFTLSATDPENGALVYSLVNSTTVPSGMTLYGSNGVIRGAPTTVGADTTTPFDVRVTDPVGNFADRSFAITVLRDTTFSDNYSNAVAYLGHYDDTVDQYWANVVSFIPADADLLNYGSSNQLTGSGHSRDTTNIKFGTASMAIALNSTTNLAFPNGAINTQAFTIEFWFKRSRIGLYEGLAWLGSNGATANSLLFDFSAGNVFNIKYGVGIPMTMGTVADTNWHHVVIQGDATGFTGYLDGTRSFTTQVPGYNLTEASGFLFGAGGVANNAYVGNFDDFRVTVGQARYSGATITVPTAAMQMPLQDYYAIPTQQLGGSVVPSTSFSKFGNAALAVANTVALSLPSTSGNYAFNSISTSAPFTVEGWFYQTSSQTANSTVLLKKNADASVNFAMRVRGSDRKMEGVVYYTGTGGSTVTAASANAVSLNEWHHIAIVGDSASNLTFYMDGVRVATSQYTRQNLTTPLLINGDATATHRGLNGYIDEVRLTNAARYSGASYDVPVSSPSLPKWTTLSGVVSSGNEKSAVSNVALVSTDPYATGHLTYALASYSTLPGDLSLLSNGVITGSYPTYTATAVSFDAIATDGNGNKTPARTFSVAPTLTTANALSLSWRLNNANTGVAYTTLTPEVGTVAPITYAAGPLMAVAPGYPGETCAYFNAAVAKFTSGTTSIRALVGDFTAETWVYATATPGTTTVRILINVGTTQERFNIVYAPGTNTWNWSYNGSTGQIGATTLNVWTHLAVVKIGTTMRMYLNGTLTATVTVVTPASTYFDSQNLTLGAYDNGNTGSVNNLMNTYVRSLNIWSIAKYTENFTPVWESFFQPYFTAATTANVEADAAIALATPATTFGNATVSYTVSNGYTAAANGLVTGPGPADGVYANVAVSATDQYGRTTPSRTYRLLGTTGDVYYSNVASLIHAEDLTDNGYVFPTYTLGSQAVISTEQAKFGSSSIKFNGAVDSIVRTGLMPTLGTNDYTFELFFYSSGLTTHSNGGYASCLLNLTNGNTSNNIGNHLGIFIGNTSPAMDYLTIQTRYATDTGPLVPGAQFGAPIPAVSLNAWHHFALVRKGDSLTAFIDGNMVATLQLPAGFVQPMIAGQTFMQYGSININNFQGAFNGYMDEMRVTPGVARYVEPFTPPTAAFGNFQDNGPSFTTKTQSLGAFYKTANVAIPVTAVANGAAVNTYTLMSGTLPGNTVLTNAGTVSGVLADVSTNTDNTFVIKATDTSGRSKTKSYTYTTLAEFDQNFSNVAFLYHADAQANVVTYATDTTGRNTIYLGNAKISAASSKFGNTALFFNTNDWNSGNLARTQANSVVIGSSNFTIESWVNLSNVSTYDIFLSTLMAYVAPDVTNNQTHSWNVGIQGSNATTPTNIKFRAYNTSGGVIADYYAAMGANFTLNTWNHVAVTREGTVINFFVNGVKLTPVANTAIGSAALQAQATSTLFLGGTSINGFQYNMYGYMDEPRITVGTARYSATFTPPSAPFPSMGNPVPTWTNNAMTYRTSANASVLLPLSAPPATTYTVTAGALPAGLSISNSGLLFGATSIANSTANSTITAVATGFTRDATLSITNEADPFIANTLSVLRANPTLTDSMGLITWAGSGNGGYSTAKSTPLNTGALSVTGAQNVLTNYIRSSGLPAAFNLGTKDWTIEFKSNITALVATADGWLSEIISIGTNSGGNAGKAIQFYYYGGTIGAGNANTITAVEFRGQNADASGYVFQLNGVFGLPITTGTWHHIALQRRGTTFTLWLNGVQVGSTTAAGAIPFNVNSDAITLGLYPYTTDSTHGYQFNGYIDDFRMTVGQARYTATFTPPDAIGGLAAPTFTTAANATVAAGYANTVLNTAAVVATSPSQATPVYSLVSGTLPSGVTFNSNGTLTGSFANTGVASATSNIVVRASVGDYTADQTFAVEYVGSTPVDPYYANTMVLLPLTGAQGSAPVELKSGRTITTASTITTVRGKWGSSSLTSLVNQFMYIDNTDGALAASGDFTMEGWFYKTAYGTGGFDNFFGAYNAGTANDTIFYTTATGVITLYVGGGSVALGGVTFPKDQWVHMAWTRASGVSRFYMNGTQFATNSSFTGTLAAGTKRLTVGGYETQAAGNSHIGQINDFRYTKGVARYTANFTPPNKPFPRG